MRGVAPVRRGVWAEMAPAEALSDAATWRLLARFGLEAAIAVRPRSAEEAAGWARRARESGVRAALWPMIEDGDGRWLSAVNARPFAAFVREVRARAPEAGVVLDLEPPLPIVRGALDGKRGAARELFGLARETEARRAGRRAIEELCRELCGDGARVTLGVVPFVLADRGDRGWGRVFGAPWGLAADHVNVMLYTTLLEGYSRGVLRREDARALLADGCRAAAARFGARASVSVGAVGAGALGDEPVYSEPAALADDAAIATAAGVTDLWLFDLGGVLSRGAPEAWLSAFVRPEMCGAAPRATARSRGAIAALWAASLGLEAASE